MKPSRSKTPSRTGVGTRTPLAPMRTPISARTGRTPARRQVSKETDTVKDPVEVFCRVRPGDGDSECLQVLNENTVQLVPPATSRAYNIGKETQCSFKYVFDEDSAQAHVFDRVGLPLVTDLVQGKNGLLFTYGVTGSGKTHTMQGTSKDGGVMTRAIDVIFNSLSELQTRKFQLKPDKLNGFEIMLDADAALERQQELVNNIKTPGRRRGAGGNISGEADLSNRIVDTQKVLVDEDMQFAVFVSYVEIYNNYTYDLLDQPKMDIVTGRQKLASKILREDSYRNMYVHGVTEVEVKSPEEALDAFYRGQKQRSVSATLLNMQSSRSHSIFNIRVVSVPLDPLGEDILCDSSALIVGQLALVDLAGSERTNRTGNTGQRLAEASKINQSLMTLRNCIEVLRDNQSSGGTKAVPYRDSRVTHLFRNYFEGEGKVKMVVCVNPRPTDYDENVNVMQFAELTQEVQIERAVGVRFDLGLTPGRRRANQVYKEAVRRLAEQGEEVEHLVMDLAPVYSLGPPWPPLELTQFDSEDIIERLRVYLEKRIGTRKTLLEDDENRQSKFRELLSKQEKEVVLLRAENKQMKVQLEGERKRVASLEQRLVSAEAANKSLNNRVAAYTDMKQVLENELDEKELELNAEQRDKLKTRQKYKAKILTEREKVAHEVGRKFSDRERDIKQKHGRTVAKLNALKNLINDDITATEDDEENHDPVRIQTLSDPNLSTLIQPSRASRRLYDQANTCLISLLQERQPDIYKAMSANVLLTESMSLEVGAQEPWPSNVQLFQPYEVEQILLPDNATCLAVQAFLHMAGLDFTIEMRSNAENMSPSGKVPFIKAGAFVVSEMEPIVAFVNTKGISLTNQLDVGQKADMRAYMSLVNNVLGNAELYISWFDEVTLNEVTKPRHGSVHPWPLSLILNWQKRNTVMKRLGALGWTSKTLEDVYAEIETCCRALSERLDNSPYFFGSKPTELDALVFGHVFSILTRPLPDNKLKVIVQQFGNLSKLCEMVEKDYFERLNSSDSDNGNFVKLP